MTFSSNKNSKPDAVCRHEEHCRPAVSLLDYPKGNSSSVRAVSYLEFLESLSQIRWWKSFLHQDMANEYELYLEASTRGYHAYFKDSTVYIGEIFFCELEPDNRYSRYAFVVKNEANRFVGHVLAELSKILNKFFIRIWTNWSRMYWEQVQQWPRKWPRTTSRLSTGWECSISEETS